MARVLGIDEAGRGCVLGPLAVGAFVVNDVPDEVLTLAGAADSKTLSAKKRMVARTALADHGESKVHLVSAVDIDRGNLNTLEESAIISLVLHYRPERVIIDALGHPSTLGKTMTRLDEAVRKSGLTVHWTIEPKADGKYPVVGAASIFAKTERDQAIEDLKDEFGDFGSGYPSDPKTKAWIHRWNESGDEWPPFVRTRWGTIRNLAQQSLIR